jgi:hypothetical protein
MIGHQIMLGVIETQQKYFKLGELEQPLQKCLQDFMEIWQKNKPAPPISSGSPSEASPGQ